MTFQYTKSLDKYLDGVIRRKLRKGISPSLSALFRNARKKAYTSNIGDFPILTHCLKKANQHGILYNRYQINHALNQSTELQKLSKGEKGNLLNQLAEHQQRTIHSSNENTPERSGEAERNSNG